MQIPSEANRRIVHLTSGVVLAVATLPMLVLFVIAQIAVAVGQASDGWYMRCLNTFERTRKVTRSDLT